MQLQNLPIRRKLMAALLLTSGAVLLLTCAAFLAYEIITLRKDMVESYRTRAQVIASNCTASLAFQNADDAAQVLGALKTDPRVTAACVYDDKGKLFAKYPLDAPAGFFPAGPGESGYRGGHLEVFCPVVQDGRPLGTVYVQSDLSALTDRYRAYAGLAAAILASSFLVAVLLSRLLQNQISKPVLALAETAQAVSKHRDFTVRAQKFGEDELGLLTDAFNQMLAEILAQNEALKISENNYRKAVESIMDYAILVLDLQGTVMTWNTGVEHFIGYNAPEIIGKNFSVFYTPEDVKRGHPQELLKRAAEQGKAEEEGYRVRKDGSRFQADVMITALKDEKGNLRGYVKMTRDVTEIKKAQRELQEKTELLNSILSNIGDGVVAADKNGKFLLFNAAAQKIVGRGAVEGGPGQWIKEYGVFRPDGVTPFPSEEVPLARAIQGESTDDVEQFLRNAGHPDGVLVSVSGRPLRDEQGEIRGGVVIVRDVTEQKRQQEMRTYTRALEVSNKELQDFVFVASHDLQEPLRKIQSFGEFLNDEYGGKLEETGKDYLERMRSAATRMQVLINDLLTLTRVTTKAKPFEKVDLSKVLKDVLSDLEIRIQEKQAKVEVGPLPMLEADATQMRQLFQNLIGNALKFQRPGVPPEIKVEAEVVGGSRMEDRQCRIRVRDNGIGFDNKYSEQIFKVFERLHGRDEYEGTGIGLAVCRKVVERHGGTIQGEGMLGKGSVFTVWLPIRQNPKGGKV